jgi:enamine deaminase RidA (YjgF/YER057c/UK114 family)
MSKIERVRSEHVGEPPEETWSNCLRIGNQVYIAGMTARGDAFDSIDGAGAYQQARIIFTKIQNLIEAAGGTMADIVKVNIFVTRIDDRKEVWRARREFFIDDFPVSTLVEVSALALPEMEVEVEAMAILGAGMG